MCLSFKIRCQLFCGYGFFVSKHNWSTCLRVISGFFFFFLTRLDHTISQNQKVSRDANVLMS